MQDIRKPYTRSRSNRDLPSRVEQFESNSYPEDEVEEFEEAAPVHIPVKKTFRTRRNVDQMDMFPRRRHDDYPEDAPRPRTSSDIVYRDPRTRYPRRTGAFGSFGTWAFIGTIVVLAGGAGLLTYVFDRATATIIPKHQDIDVHKTILFSREGDGVPFVIATSSMSKSKSLPLSETKKVEAKASGSIIIYNKFDTEPQKLIKNTRFESTSGKVYRINQSVTVPGMKGNVPGSVEVTVYADSYGADYNSAATDFTIPGFKGTPRYAGFYARSNGSITGGSSGNVSLASLTDINAAKDELAIELAQSIKAELGKVKKDGYTGLYSAIAVEYADNEADILRGVSSVYEVTATGYLMFADSGSLAKELAKDIRNYKGEDVRLGYEDTLVYTTKDTARIATDTSVEVLVVGSPRIIWVTPNEAIKEMLAGKPREEFQPLMRTIDAVEGGEISFSPLWLSNFPDETEKISVVEFLPKR